MSKRLCIGFSLLEISYWSFHASFIGFISAFLLENGISNTMLSLLIAGYFLCTVIGSFVWGAVCDYLHTNKKVLLITLGCSAVLMYLIYFFSSNAILLFILYPLLGFTSMPSSSNIDVWLLTACKHDLSLYGKIRCTPSILYGIVSFFLGKMINSHGYSLMLGSATFFIILGISMVILLPEINTASNKSDPVQINLSTLKKLFASKEYIFLIIILFLLGLVIAPINNLKATIISSVNGTVADIGIDAFFGTAIQAVFIFLAGYTNKLPLKVRYLIVTFMPWTMLILTFVATSTPLVFAGTFIYNIGYGVMLPLMRCITERCVDKDLQNLGQNIADSTFTSASAILSLLYSGAIIDAFGVKAMLLLCIAISSIACLMACFKKKEKDALADE